MVGSGLVSSSVVVVVAWSESIRKNVIVVVVIERSGCCFCVRVEWLGGYISDLVSDGGATGTWVVGRQHWAGGGGSLEISRLPELVGLQCVWLGSEIW